MREWPVIIERVSMPVGDGAVCKEVAEAGIRKGIMVLGLVRGLSYDHCGSEVIHLQYGTGPSDLLFKIL